VSSGLCEEGWTATGCGRNSRVEGLRRAASVAVASGVSTTLGFVFLVFMFWGSVSCEDDLEAVWDAGMARLGCEGVGLRWEGVAGRADKERLGSAVSLGLDF